MTEQMEDLDAEATEATETSAETADEVVEKDQADGQETPDAESAAAKEDAEDKDEGEESRKSGIQRRIDQLTREKYEERRRAELAERELARLKEEAAKQQPQAGQPPRVDDFDTYEDFLRAQVQYELEQREALRNQEASLSQQAQQRADVQVRVEKTFEQGRGRYEDFDEVVTNPNVPVTDAMVEAIATSDVGADVAYFLGKNPAEAARLAALPPLELGRAIALIEMQVSRQPEKKLPDPVPTVPKAEGKAKAVEPDPDSLPIDEWMRRYGGL